MLTFHVDIVSSEKEIFSGTAHRLSAPTELGEIGILARHAPMLSRLRPGLVSVILEPDSEEFFFVSSGFLEVQPHIVTVLADTVLRTPELDDASARAALARKEEEMKLGVGEADYNHFKAELQIEAALLRSIEQLRIRGRGR